MAKHEPCFERIACFPALVAAAERAARQHRRSPEVAGFLLELEPGVLQLERELRDGSYRPRPYRTFAIRDPKPRSISVAAFRDRVVHHALCAEIEPVLEAGAVPWSYACRKGKGLSAALAHVRRRVRHLPFALKLDVRHFFETLSHDVLKRLLARRIRDPRTRWLTERFIDAGAPGSEAGRGLPIGNLTSQHFANFYLGPLDRHLLRGLRVGGYCRYMDDVLIFAEDKKSLWHVHAEVDEFVRARLAIELKGELTRVIPVSEGVPFLGFVIFPGTVRFDPARARRWRSRMRLLDQEVARGRISDDDARQVADSLLGWARHGDTLAFRRAWVGRRVRGPMRQGGAGVRTG